MIPDPVRTSLTVTVTAFGSHGEDQLAAFAAFCKTLQRLGQWGSSRTVQIDYDGDGAARLRFDFGETDVSAVKPAAIGDGIVRCAGID